jgi:hypothetical protein
MGFEDDELNVIYFILFQIFLIYDSKMKNLFKIN